MLVNKLEKATGPTAAGVKAEIVVQIECVETARDTAARILDEIYADQSLPLDLRNKLNEISEALDVL